MKLKLKQNWIKIISWMAVAAWMAVIFYLSHQPAEKSNALSSGITEMIIAFLEGILPDTEFHLSELNHLLRKNAHFVAYFILSLLTMNAFGRSGVKGRKRIIRTMFICVIYAITDEVHQLFIPGRAGQVKDVVIDSLGAATGAVVYTISKRALRGLQK